jgi:uncharacterized membrane-anchored protein
MARNIAVLAMLVILALVNWSIAGKERQLAEGRIVYLDLAPVDPRSLMQGDYMALRFRIADQLYQALPRSEDSRNWRHDVQASDGYVVVNLDEQQIASYQRIHKAETLASDELLLRYRVRDGAVKFATNAFFFQEGQAEIYQPARYGQFRVDESGELLLVAMFDKDLKKLQPQIKDAAVPKS